MNINKKLYWHIVIYTHLTDFHTTNGNKSVRGSNGRCYKPPPQSLVRVSATDEQTDERTDKQTEGHRHRIKPPLWSKTKAVCIFLDRKVNTLVSN